MEVLEFARLTVEQHDAERPVVDDPAGELRDAGQQLVEIQDRRDIAADLGEGLQRVGVLTLPLEQSRILDGHRHGRRELAQHLLVGLRELARHAAQEVQRPQDPAFAPQRDDELRLRAGNSLPVARVRGDIIDEQRPAFGHGGANQRLADLQAQRASRLLGIPDRVRNAQLAPAFVQQVDGECLEIDEPLDQPRHFPQQLIQIENGGDLAAEVEEDLEDLLVGRPGLRGRAARARSGAVGRR
jgi:hypothetical protein